MNSVKENSSAVESSAVKTSKKRHKKCRTSQQLSVQNKEELKMGQVANVNGEKLDGLSENLEKNLHIKENGCIKSHLTDNDRSQQEHQQHSLQNGEAKGSRGPLPPTGRIIKNPEHDNIVEIFENGASQHGNNESKLITAKSSKKTRAKIHTNGKSNCNGNAEHKDDPDEENEFENCMGSLNLGIPEISKQSTQLRANEKTDNNLNSSINCHHQTPNAQNEQQPEQSLSCNENKSHSNSIPSVNQTAPTKTELKTIEDIESTKAIPGVNAAVAAAQPNTSSPLPAVVNVLDPANIVIDYKQYESELQMQDIMRLIQAELSEPYSIYTYRYFIYNWPKLCFLAAHGDEYVGAIVCKLDMHMNLKRGYIAMLAVKKEYRKLKIGTNLVQKAIEAMLADEADEVVLETEMKNIPALRLYENLGFVRDKRLFRYYLNGVDALRLKLWFR